MNDKTADILLALLVAGLQITIGIIIGMAIERHRSAQGIPPAIIEYLTTGQ